jgi:ABC-type phosphate transport system permease subunit
VLRAREFEYVTAAKALGAGTLRVLIRHVLPTAVPPLLVQATLGMAGAILSEAALSFLGLGVQPPTPSWGTMINGGRVHLLDAPHLTIFPACSWRSWCSASISSATACAMPWIPAKRNLPHFLAARKCAGSFFSGEAVA